MSDAAITEAAELRVEKRGGVALVTLNRPKALNALTHTMVVELGDLLRAWATDPEVGAVIVMGAGEKAFCAGGDIRKLYDARLAGEVPTAFFRDEYRMNSAIHHFPKPYIAIMDGVTMGGGVGISAPARYRVATDRTLWAMPETGIGLFPDVGGSWHLSRLAERLGLYLGLTGHRLKAADLIWAGLATHHLASDQVGVLIDALVARPDDIDDVLSGYHSDPGPAPLMAHQADIDRLFAADSVAAIMSALSSASSDWAQATVAHLGRMSPTSLRLTFEASRLAADMEFDDVLRMEFRIVSRIMQGLDFVDGVRAVLVDRDHTPRWSPASVAEVSDAEIARYFAPLPDGELPL